MFETLKSLLNTKRRSDVVCISYPKSGRTWVRYATTLAGANIEFTHAGYGTKDLKEIGNPFTSIHQEYFGDRNIFLYRNPLDVAVSMYHQIHNRNFSEANSNYKDIHAKLSALNRLPSKNIDQFVLDPIWGYEKVARYIAAHLKFFERQANAIQIRYEDLITDPTHYFSKILDFSNVAKYNIDEVVEQSNFNRMQELELSNDREIQKAHKLYGLKNDNPDTLKVRKGKINGYVDTLKAETVIEAKLKCASLGYVFE